MMVPHWFTLCFYGLGLAIMALMVLAMAFTLWEEWKQR